MISRQLGSVGTTVAGSLSPSCVTTSLSEYLLSLTGLKRTNSVCPNVYLFRLLNSSSLLPENIGPVITIRLPRSWPFILPPELIIPKISYYLFLFAARANPASIASSCMRSFAPSTILKLYSPMSFIISSLSLSSTLRFCASL